MDISKPFLILDHARTGGERAAARGRGPGATIMVTTGAVDRASLDLRARSPWLRVWSRLLAPTLDRRLAAGERPESGALLAARAETLVSRGVRLSLARNWQDLVDQAGRPVDPWDPRVPLCRDRIDAAEVAVRSIVHALSTEAPVPARGVAMASALLSDGTGPLYNRRCAVDLAAALREVEAQLDPGIWLD